MRHYLERKVRHPIYLLLSVMLLLFLSGCNVKKEDGEKVRDLEFTVLAEKRTQPFKMTFTDEQNLYIAVGYGPQQTGGYSIQVEELYLTDNAIVLDTELMGPGKEEAVAPETSYPTIIIRTELLENPVIFK